MAEATTTFAVGDRVRLVNNRAMNAPVGSTATVTREPYTSPYSGTLLLGVEWDRPEGFPPQNDGGYAADQFVSASAPLDSAPVPVPVVVGMRIRVRQESATQGRDYTGEPPVAYQGHYGVVGSGRRISDGTTFEDYRTVLQVDLDNGERGVGVYVGWIEPDTAPLAVNDWVRIHDGEIFASEGHGWVDPSFRGQMAQIVRVDEDGQTVVQSAVHGRQLIHASYLTRVSAPPEIVNPMEVGTRVATSTGKGTVISKDDERLDAYIRSNRGYVQSDRYVAVLRDGERVGQMMSMDSVNVVVDVLEGLSPEQQILRLQTLIHRVASYEAVRRDWCQEVNGALAMLNLPDHLSQVDRDLGRALGQNPRLIFQLDAEIEGVPDDDDDEDDEDCQHDYIADIDVSYYADAGFRVSGATVSIGFRASCQDDDYSDCIDGDMVRDAINSHGDLPRCDSLDDWSIDDVNEN